MSRRKKENSSSGGPAPWLTTWSDFMSLLLTFFIMLYSFSTINAAKFREALISLQGALGVLSGGPALLSPGELPIPPVNPSQVGEELGQGPNMDPELVAIKSELTQFLNERGLSDKVYVELNRRGLLIRFTDTVLFDLGRADLRTDSKELLNGIAKFLEPIQNDVMVEGHTDNIPLRPDAPFATNWELSTARATTVVRYFIEELGLVPGRFSAAGYGEYRPVLPNTSDANRALNRRVDIVIIASDEYQIPDFGASKNQASDKNVSQSGSQNASSAGKSDQSAWPEGWWPSASEPKNDRAAKHKGVK